MQMQPTKTKNIYRVNTQLHQKASSAPSGSSPELAIKIESDNEEQSLSLHTITYKKKGDTKTKAKVLDDATPERSRKRKREEDDKTPTPLALSVEEMRTTNLLRRLSSTLPLKSKSPTTSAATSPHQSDESRHQTTSDGLVTSSSDDSSGDEDDSSSGEDEDIDQDNIAAAASQDEDSDLDDQSSTATFTDDDYEIKPRGKKRDPKRIRIAQLEEQLDNQTESAARAMNRKIELFEFATRDFEDRNDRLEEELTAVTGRWLIDAEGRQSWMEYQPSNRVVIMLAQGRRKTTV